MVGVAAPPEPVPPIVMDGSEVNDPPVVTPIDNKPTLAVPLALPPGNPTVGTEVYDPPELTDAASTPSAAVAVPPVPVPLMVTVGAEL
jgi:hypothetical protein